MDGITRQGACKGRSFEAILALETAGRGTGRTKHGPIPEGSAARVRGLRPARLCLRRSTVAGDHSA